MGLAERRLEREKGLNLSDKVGTENENKRAPVQIPACKGKHAPLLTTFDNNDSMGGGPDRIHLFPSCERYSEVYRLIGHWKGVKHKAESPAAFLRQQIQSKANKNH